MTSAADDSELWNDELIGLVDDHIVSPYSSSILVDNTNSIKKVKLVTKEELQSESLKDHAVEFAKAIGELAVELGKGCRDIVRQSVVNEESYVMRKFGGYFGKVGKRLSFLNDYLPEDRDPVHSWTVISIVLFLSLAVLSVNTGLGETSVPFVKSVYIHPPSAALILLPDGRHLAYQEKGAAAEIARFSVISPHAFLSSRLAGIPGLKDPLLVEFGVRLITYDLPGFGESDPHPTRSLESSALDMSYLADALNVTDKFWVLGFSEGSMHAWASLKYIPERLAGAAIVAPFVNPYEPQMTKEEKHGTWAKWTRKRKLLYLLARRSSRLLAYFYRKSFLTGTHGQIDDWLSLSLGKRDISLKEEPKFIEFWERNVEEAIRQGSVEPLVEEAVLQVADWGFSLSELKMQKKLQGKGIIQWLKSLYDPVEEDLSGFLGPIHLWQGMDDRVVPPAMTDFVHRILPDTIVHKLPYDGHFTYFYFCEECHRQMFITIFGAPKGPLSSTMSMNKEAISISRVFEEKGEEENTIVAAM